MFPVRLIARQSASLATAYSRRSFATVDATVLRFTQHGKPSEVLKASKEQISTDLKPNEVFVRMEAAPINPADINYIEGTYGMQAKLPAVAGLEGVGSVAAVGSAVKGLKPNDRVIPAKAGFGTWRSHAVATEDSLVKVPGDIPLHYAATISVNPSTAYRLLNDFAKLQKGDVIIQNGANSMVGTAVIQLAKARGIHTINIIRDRTEYEETVELLKNLGGDIVCHEKFLRTPQFKSIIAELPKPKLALNCVGGDSATEIARNLADGGHFVTYGGMSRQPINLPTSLFIFKNIHCHGFWLTKWIEQNSAEERTKMINELSELIRTEKLKLFMEGHKLSDFEFALKRNSEVYRDRKVVLELMH